MRKSSLAFKSSLHAFSLPSPVVGEFKLAFVVGSRCYTIKSVNYNNLSGGQGTHQNFLEPPYVIDAIGLVLIV